MKLSKIYRQRIEILLLLLATLSSCNTLSPADPRGGNSEIDQAASDRSSPNYYYITDFNAGLPIEVAIRNDGSAIFAVEIKNLSGTLIDLSDIKIAAKYHSGLVDEIKGTFSSRFIPPEGTVILSCNYELFDWGLFGVRDSAFQKEIKTDPIQTFDIIVLVNVFEKVSLCQFQFKIGMASKS